MDRDLGKNYDATWVAQCAHELREHWPRLDLQTLEQVAQEIGMDPKLAELDGARAAAVWLSPLLL